jgi:hypothetical protein
VDTRSRAQIHQCHPSFYHRLCLFSLGRPSSYSKPFFYPH